MKFLRKIMPALLAFLLLGGLCASAQAPLPAQAAATILFTHDTHSHFLPAPAGEGREYGGYTRLATLLKEERAKADGAVITLDAGDFSMGTLFQVLYAEQAAELRILGELGYDATTLGNHEFDYRGQGLADMLRAALKHGRVKTDEAVMQQMLSSYFDPTALPINLPPIVQANYKPPKEGAVAQDVQAALDEYGVSDYIMIERDGVRFAVFGVMGVDSDECAPMSGMEFEPIASAAKRVVAEIQAKEEYDFLICLSHSGTNPDPKKSEDEQLAKAVPGIDVILSGHTHTTLNEPIVVNGTIIASCGEYTKNLGVLKVEKDHGGTVRALEYRLVPVDETVADDPDIVAQVEEFKQLANDGYLKRYGMEFDQVLATAPFGFTPIEQFGVGQSEDTLGNLIADSYIYAVQYAEGDNYIPVDLALVGAGVVRGSFPAGPITVSDVYNVSSLGVGADGIPGYPLISVYLTGRELRDVFEVDASVTPIMPSAQLYMSGMRYTFNPNRMLFNKVTDWTQVLPNGAVRAIEPDKLYRVVTGLYSGQMLGAVNAKSFGILSVVAKYADGTPVEDFETCIITDGAGNEVKEWYALASYLETLEVIPDQYAAPEGRKVIKPSRNPIELLKNPNWVTLTVIGVVLLLIAIIVLVVILVRKRVRRKRGYRK